MSKITHALLIAAAAGQAQIVHAQLAENQQNQNVATAAEMEVALLARADLHQQDAPLSPVVVSAQRIDRPIEDVIGSIAVMTSQQLIQQVVTDFNQLFRYEPGVTVSGSIGGAQNISIRGMGGNRVLMIKDGMRMNEGYGANGLNDIVGRGFIDTDTLKQVEVVKGAASSLYGSDALSGIVVFTTKEASDYLAAGETIGGAVSAGYSDDSRQINLGGTVAVRTGPVDHLLSVGGRKGKEQQNYHKSKEAFDIDSQSVLYKARLHLNEHDSIGFSADLWDQETDGGRAEGLLSYFRGLAQFGYNIASESQRSEKETRSYKLDYRSDAERLLYDQLDVSLYYNSNTQLDTEHGVLDIKAPMFGTFEMRDMRQDSRYRQRTTGLRASASKVVNDMHQLGYGLDVESTRSERSVAEKRVVAGNPASPNNRDEKVNKFPKNKIERYGLYLNDTISLQGGRWQIVPGVRFDRYEMDPGGATQNDGTPFRSINKDNFSFNLGTLYEISPAMSAYLQYGQGFKVPAYDLAYIQHDLTATSTYRYTIVPNGDLSPEKSDTYELGLRGQAGALSYNAAVYYNKYRDFLETALIDSTTTNGLVHDTFHYRNVDSVTIKGVELSLSYALNSTLRVYGNASWQDGKNDKTGEYLTSISPLSGIVGLGYRDSVWNSDLVVNWARRMTKVNDGETKTSGYGTVDWLLGYRFANQLSFNLAVFNLLDKKYHRHNTVAGHAESADLTSLLQAGRTFNASVRYSF